MVQVPEHRRGMALVHVDAERGPGGHLTFEVTLVPDVDRDEAAPRVPFADLDAALAHVRAFLEAWIAER
jgi:hypothetical protein